MAILFPLIVLFTIDHLSVRSIPCDGASAPFIFNVAILMFALFLWCMFLSVAPDVGVPAVGWVVLLAAFGGACIALVEVGVLIPLHTGWLLWGCICLGMLWTGRSGMAACVVRAWCALFICAVVLSALFVPLGLACIGDFYYLFRGVSFRQGFHCN